MQATKRERCINWEKEEKQLFRNILRPYLAIIENKDLSTNTNKEKMKAWNEITEKFNLANVRNRDKKQLMNQWKCLKLNSKKELSSFRRETSKTGGGPRPPSPSPDVLEVAEMIPQEFEVDFNEFDCDGLNIMDVSDITMENTEEEHKENTEPKSEQPTTNAKKFAQKTQDLTEEIENKTKSEPQETKKSTKKAQKTSKDSFNFGEASYADMHSFRVIENERLQKEHELRMKNMAEIHSQVMTNLKLQTEILRKTLESHNKKEQ